MKTVMAPKLRLEVQLDAATFDAKARTVDMSWYTGATVQRYNFMEGPYQLTFSMDAKSMDLGRLNSGSAPFRGDHSYGVKSVLGVIEKAWVEKGVGKATVRFSSRPDVQPLVQDIREGILKNVSMEAVIHELEDVTEKGAAQRSYLAVKWEPQAVALVDVNADKDAQILESEDKFPLTIRGAVDAPPERKIMKIKVRLLGSNEIVEILEAEFDEKLHSKDLTVPTPTPTPTPSNVVPMDAAARKRFVDDAIAADNAYQTEVKRLGAQFGCDLSTIQRCIHASMSIEQTLEVFTADKARRTIRVVGQNDGAKDDYESVAWRMERMAEAIAAKATHKEVPEKARQYGNSKLVDMALECLTFRGLHYGLDARVDPTRIVQLALTTADYPNLLANAANKILRPAYDAATPTYRLLAERQDLADFKTASVLKVGDFPLPLQVAEAAEIKLGSFSEAKDTFALTTYGRRLSFSFQSIVNDDLNAFSRVMGAAGVRIADFENGLWFTLLTSASGVGPTLGDTGALFNATAVTTAGGHANYTSSGTAISVASLGVGRAAMRKQVSLDGLKLNIVPRFLVTGPDQETLARQFLTQITPALGSSVNPWSGIMEPVIDANLTSTPWYMFADPGRAAVSVYGFLAGEGGPQVATRPGFETLGVEMRVTLNFGVAFIDFRGAYRNAGA